MSSLSVFVKPTEKEMAELKNKISKNKDLLKEIDIGGSSLLHIAIIHSDLDFAKFLIDKGMDVNLQDNKGDTALHYCAAYNQYEIAECILEHNGKLDISDKYGNEPLWTATQNYKNYDDRIAIVKLFFGFGANKEHKNNAGKTPSDIAARYPNLTELFNTSID
jgi:ankyrin repeat protein